jgi:hypothetical protein
MQKNELLGDLNVNPHVVQAREYETFDCPLYRTIRREGLVA